MSSYFRNWMKRFRLATVFRATVKSFKTIVILGSQNYKKKRNCYSLQKKIKFSITDFFSKCDFFTFTEETLNGKYHFLCSDSWTTQLFNA